MGVYIEERHWGEFESYVVNEKCSVKILYLKPNSQQVYNTVANVIAGGK